MKRLEEALKKSGIFSALSASELKGVADTSVQVNFPAGSLIAQEGDEGNECYIILDGIVQVFTVLSDGQEIVLAKREEGEVIGEQSLLPGSSGYRNASLRAYTNIILLRITKKAFQAVLVQDNPLKEKLLRQGEEQVKDKLLRQSSLFRSLPFGTAGHWYKKEVFADGQVVFSQGSYGNKLYLIMSGKADVFEEKEGEQKLILQLSTGRTFGEKALLEKKPRSATVIANGELKVFSIDGAKFLELYDEKPEIREYIKTLKRVYPLAGNNFASQYFGKFMGLDCLTTVTSLPDGTTVVSSLVIGQDIFNMSVVLEDDTKLDALRFQDLKQGSERELLLLEKKVVGFNSRAMGNSRVVGVTAQGQWSELGKVYRAVLEQKTLESYQIELFKKEGTLWPDVALPAYENEEIVCECMEMNRGHLLSQLEGCKTAEDLIEQTGAGTICGACKPLLQEMVGYADWTNVTITETFLVAEEIRSFSFKPQQGKFKPAKPGQHILVQARIDGKWVQRPYTISSAAKAVDYREIIVEREEKGYFSNWLFADNWQEVPMRVSSPQGDFCADLSELGPIVCLAGDIGITPFLAICRTIIKEDNKEQILHLDYSAKNHEKLVCIEELQDIAKNHENITVNLRTIDQENDVSVVDIQQIAREYPNARYYVSGPSYYQEAVQACLKAANIPKKSINIGEFNPIGDKPPKQNKNYFFIGLVFLILFAVQDEFGIKFFESTREGEIFKRWTGLLLTLYIAAQFILPVVRLTGRVKLAAQHYQIHKLQGAFAPIVYYIHSTTMGYGYLGILSAVFFGNFILGLFNHEMMAKPSNKKRYSNQWLVSHVFLAVILVGLIGYHIYIVLLYK